MKSDLFDYFIYVFDVIVFRWSNIVIIVDIISYYLLNIYYMIGIMLSKLYLLFN